MHNKLKNGVEVEESQNSDSVSLSPAERITIVWNNHEPQLILFFVLARLVFEILLW